MSIDDRLPELQDAIWKRLGKGSFLRPTGLLEKLGKDLGIHPDDVRRGFIRLKEQGWLGNVASNGIPLGQVSILAPKPAEAEPASGARHCSAAPWMRSPRLCSRQYIW